MDARLNGTRFGFLLRKCTAQRKIAESRTSATPAATTPVSAAPDMPLGEDDTGEDVVDGNGGVVGADDEVGRDDEVVFWRIVEFNVLLLAPVIVGRAPEVVDIVAFDGDVLR